MVCGPFSLGADDVLEQVLPPEETVDFSARYEGADGQVGWREAEAKDGVLNSGKIFGRVWRVGYHLQYVHSPEERKALLRIGHNGGTRLWLNDAEAFYTHFRFHNYREESIPVVLRQGWNKLLIKSECMYKTTGIW